LKPGEGEIKKRGGGGSGNEVRKLMVVRLQTVDGKTKEYQTIQGICGGENNADSYVTRCGRKCDGWPKNSIDYNYLNCNHLDCAVYLAEINANSHDGRDLMIISAIILILGSNWLEFYAALFLSGCFALTSLYNLHLERTAKKKLEELAEFRDMGTINGINAYQIDE
jgi:hypothetical protein